MRKLPIILLALIAIPQICAAEDDFCVWNHICVKKKIDDRWGAGFISEARAREMKPDHYYVRPFVSCNITPALQAKMQVDFASVSSGFCIRYLPEATYTMRTGGLSLSVRQRMMVSWTESTDKWSLLWRTKATATCKIPDTKLSPLVAVEPFYKDGISRCRYYAGIRFALDGQSSLSLQYVRQDYNNAHADENIVWLMYTITLH